MEDENNLPVLHESERELSAVERIRVTIARRDGFLSPSNAHVPEEAVDVGSGDANPSSEALGYSGARVKSVVEYKGKTYLADGREGPTAELGIDSENFIEDVSDWA